MLLGCLRQLWLQHWKGVGVGRFFRTGLAAATSFASRYAEIRVIMQRHVCAYAQQVVHMHVHMYMYAYMRSRIHVCIQIHTQTDLHAFVFP